MQTHFNFLQLISYMDERSGCQNSAFYDSRRFVDISAQNF